MQKKRMCKGFNFKRKEKNNFQNLKHLNLEKKYNLVWISVIWQVVVI